jgi:DNA invertase Pin-like site-specific DNA recombinase
MSKNIGYIRVSTVEQNTDRQLDGVDLDKTYEDKVSGATTNRPQLQTCLDYLRDGDTFTFTALTALHEASGTWRTSLPTSTARA